jgi:DNA-binding response OmpR family regulator
MEQIRVLIIEDDAEISRLTVMYLELEGYDTKVIDDGLDAISAIKSYQPNVVILDLLLPNLSGIKVCKQARSFYFGPILVVSACGNDAGEVSLLQLGADDFLTKPLKPDVLVARIEALIRRTNTQQYFSKNKLV